MVRNERLGLACIASRRVFESSALVIELFSGSLHFLYMETILSSLKRTISETSNSDSSQSSSPREKRSKSLAEEDEVLQALRGSAPKKRPMISG